MRRSSVFLAGLVSCTLALVALTGCGDSSSTPSNPDQNVKTVTLSPASGSVNVGGTLQFQINVKDNSDNSVVPENVTFKSSNPAVVSIANNGLACGGTWDSTTTPVVCTAGAVGTADITATVGSVTSAPVTVYVHQKVEKVVVTPASIGVDNCLSQTKTQDFQAHAYSQDGTDITGTVGTFSWQSITPAVATVAGKDASTGTVTAVAPGQTTLVANISGVQSLPATFTTCPVKKISIHLKDSTATSATTTAGGAVVVVADVTDTAGLPVTNANLTWSSTEPLVATATGGGVNTNVAGVTAISASCSSPNCNTGLSGAIYSNAFVTTATNTSATSTTVYAASTQGTSLVPIDTSTNTAGTAITLGDKPNSMLISARGGKVYLGSASGLIIVDVVSGTASTPSALVPGKVLAAASDETIIITSDGSKAYIYNSTVSGNNVQTLNIPGIVAATFSPDNTKVYLVGNGNLSVWSSTTTPVPENVGGAANDAAFLTTGAFGFIAGSGSGLGSRAACNDSPNQNVTTSAAPTHVAALPDGAHLLAVTSPNMDLITAASDNVGCPPQFQQLTATHTAMAGTAFTARQLIVVPDGSKAYVTSNQGGVLLGYDVANNSSAPIQLGGGATETFTGGTTIDGRFLYVGAGGVNAIHRIDLGTGLDVQQIPMSFVPDLVAVRPR